MQNRRQLTPHDYGQLPETLDFATWLPNACLVFRDLSTPRLGNESLPGPHHLQPRGAAELVAGVDLGDVGQEVQDTAGVAPLVVVPADELDKVLVERDAGLGVEDGRGVVALEIARDDLVLGVGEDAWGFC
jgi:hypothetical protein